jgi:hypothetical protein
VTIAQQNYGNVLIQHQFPCRLPFSPLSSG